MPQSPQPDPLKVTMVQTDLYWKDRTANLSMLEEKILSVDEKTDMIVLPEMFSTGFTMDAGEVAEPMNFNTTRWMRQIASQTEALVTGSIVVRENGEFFNRLLWVRPNGEVDFYDKRHLFRMAGEDRYYSMGKESKVFEWKGWKLLPQVCYDLRFPVWTRNKAQDGEMAYDLIYFVASWPSPRVSAWDILLQARAVENLSYSLGVNRIGVDGNGVPYSGHSAVYSFKGEKKGDLGEGEGIMHVTLDYDALDDYRNKFPAWMDADSFELK